MEKKLGKYESKGITLIALIVTIIVLLILAGVSIATLTGDNGLLTKTQQAKEENEKAEQEEKYNLAQQEDFINEYISGVTVEQVTDINPGVLEENGTEYTINSIEDLVFFAYDVTNGNNYEGKTVKLGTSLDFNSTKSYVDPFTTNYGEYGYDGELKTLLTSGEGFKSIGITTKDDNTKNFFGTFDGNNNFINNLYINVTSDAEFEKRGLFANNYGTINNLKLANVNLYLNNKKGHLGGISGQNSMTGRINNCIVSGNIKLEGTDGRVAGITSYCSGRINNCGNLANVYNFTSNISEERTYVGGIFSNSGGKAEIINCYNRGKITGMSQRGNLLIGGIGGTNSGKIENCYNTGNVSGEAAERVRVGGILGVEEGSVESCYTTGEVNGKGTQVITVGMILGYKLSNTITKNVYYRKVDETPGIGLVDEGTSEDEVVMQKTEEQMKQDSFVDLLNSGNNGVVWKKDTSNINDGYPILEWE